MRGSVDVDGYSFYHDMFMRRQRITSKQKQK